MFDFMTIARALTDENRVRILMALREREMCVCQVTAFLDLSPSTTSKHLSILRQARLIESRKNGKWVYYRVPQDPLTPARVRKALEWVAEEVRDSRIITEDAVRIERILERERQLCPGHAADADAFHSLEIHTMSEPDEASADQETGHAK